jgi:hypothetical protein
MQDHCSVLIASDATSQGNILRHQRDPMCVNGAKVRIFQQTHHRSLTGFLQGKQGRGLEASHQFRVLLVFLRNIGEGTQYLSH